MTVIALAGCSGGVGTTILEELRHHPDFTVYVLSRSPAEPASGNVQYLQTDYRDVSLLAENLQSLSVHTVISAINLVSEETAQSQLNLIEAANQSSTTKRFIPSEYAFITNPGLQDLDPTTRWWINAVDSLRKTSLEFTRFAPGFFMDYWGMPNVRTSLPPYTFAIDMANCKAAIPGDGNDIISLTYSIDFARYLVEALSLPSWQEWSIVVGEDISFNDFLKLAEEVRGQKFQTVHDSMERLLVGEVTMLPIPSELEISEAEIRESNALFGLMAANGNFALPKTNRLNAKFPHIKPQSLKEFLTSAWN